MYSAYNEFKKCEDKRYSSKSSLWVLMICVSLVAGWLVSLVVASDIVKIYSLTSLILVVLIIETSREYLFNKLIICDNGVYINKVYFEKSRIKGYGFGHNKKHGNVIRLVIKDLEKGQYIDYVIMPKDEDKIETILNEVKIKKLKFN